MRSEALEVGIKIGVEFTKTNTHGVFTSHLPPLMARGERWAAGSGVRRELTGVDSNSVLTSKFSHLNQGISGAKSREVSIW
ncbi:MAG: hypothetical protein K6T66_10220 [Peptococcaceae bacterium]|nr:hypothetical protein [Peptococcaceae bacterium]